MFLLTVTLWELARVNPHSGSQPFWTPEAKTQTKTAVLLGVTLRYGIRSSFPEMTAIRGLWQIFSQQPLALMSPFSAAETQLPLWTGDTQACAQISHTVSL